MQPKRNPLNKLDLVVCLEDRVRNYRLDLGVERRESGRLRCASSERGEGSKLRREEARRNVRLIRYCLGRMIMLQQRTRHDWDQLGVICWA